MIFSCRSTAFWYVIGRILNFALRKALLDGGNHPAHRIQAIEVFPAAFFHIEREAFEEIRAAQRIRSVRDCRSRGR